MSEIDSGAIPETGEEATLDIAVYVRGDARSAARERQRAMVERFEELADDDRIGSIEVRRWSSRITVPADATEDSEAIAAFEAIERETADRAVDLRPCFDEDVDAEGNRVVVLPVICVTIHRDGGLRGLYPCWCEAGHTSVADCLDAFEAGDPVENLSQ